MKRNSTRVLAVMMLTGMLSPLPPASSGQKAGQPRAGEPVEGRLQKAEIVRMETGAQEIARGIALALSQAKLRSRVQNAMRDSQWLEHKLILQDYAKTAEGRTLVTEAARHLGRTPEDLQKLLASLPTLDFYAPFPSHRKSWKATSEVLVGATLDPDTQTLIAYDVAGNPLTLLRADGVPSWPLLVLHPAERKTLNPVRARFRSDVIEAPEESIRARELATIPKSGPGFYLTHYNIQIGEGFGGSLEMEFQTHYRVAGQASASQPATLTQSGVVEDRGYTVNLFLNSYPGINVPLNAFFEMDIWEMDGGSGSINQNDYYGSRQYPPSPTNGLIHDYYQGSKRSAWIGITAR